MMNKRDYQKAGFEHARDMMGTVHAGKDPVKEPMFPRHKDSWQAKAYWEGYDSYTTDKARAARYDRVLQSNGSPTGRMISTAPNLQTIPNKSAEAEKVKAAFCHPLIRGFGRSRAATDYFMHNLVIGQIKVPAAWPDGARAHAADLAKQYMKESGWRRRSRLSRAVARLYDRHRAAVIAANITFVSYDEAQEFTQPNQD